MYLFKINKYFPRINILVLLKYYTIVEGFYLINTDFDNRALMSLVKSNLFWIWEVDENFKFTKSNSLIEKYLGYNDWKLPNAKEMHSILDYTRSPQATNSAAINERPTL